MTPLWHYTCDHAAPGIRRDGLLYPFPHPLLPEPLVWLTDLAMAWRVELGLTSHTLGCDRTVHRFRVADPTDAIPWVRYRRHLPPDARAIEDTPGALLAHWWVSTTPVPIERGSPCPPK